MATLLVAAILTASCVAATGNASTGEAFDDIANISQNVSRGRSYDSVQGLAAMIAAGEVPYDAQVVLGDITAIERGIGAFWTDTGQRIELPWGDHQAWGNTAHLTIDVSETLAGPAADKQITVGLAFGPRTSFDSIEADFGSLSSVVLFVHDAGVFDYQSGILTIIEDGQIFGIVDDNDRVEFPFLHGLALATPGSKSDETLLLESGRLALADLRQPGR